MEFQFNILKNTRKNLLGLIANLTEEQLNKIPDGFNNNIAWNFNHIIITQYLLCYKLSGNSFDISKELVKKYCKGSHPSGQEPISDINFFKDITLSSVEELKADYKKGLFKNYNEYPTSYNVVLKSIEDAIAFNNAHETLHLGYIMALKKAI